VSRPVPRVIKGMGTIIIKDAQNQKTETVLKSRQSALPAWNTNSNFFVENGLKGIVNGLKNEHTALKTETAKPLDIQPVTRHNQTHDWLLGIFFLLVVLFVWIRTFYSKFFGTLANALISFHLSVKLFEEKNVLSHRVSIVLDFIYIVVFSVFIFEFIDFTHFSGVRMTGFNLFLLLINILMLYTLMRNILLRLTGSLFLVRPLFLEYIHNTFVINKGLGIALFPVVIMAQYLPHCLAPAVLWTGVILFGLAILYKTMRAYQIIIRRDVLLFYLILYLCTLEILPLLLGYKFVTSLIQSN